MDYERPQPEDSTTEAETASEHQPKYAADGVNSIPSTKKDANPWVETLTTIGMSIFLALGIRTFVAEARYIPSGSMLPTLQIDDRLIIDKISYRFADPVRGDIVVFDPTAQLAKEKYKDAFIKRVIGLPGDRVTVKGGKVYINDKLLTERYLDEPPATDWSTTDRYTTDNEGQHRRLPWPADGRVPKGQYLVLGDNRNNSYDSHYWGFVPKDKIIGKASVRFWPINRAGGIDPQPDYR